MIYIYATGIIAALIIIWMVFISPCMAAIARIHILEDDIKDLALRAATRDKAITQHHQRLYQHENQLRALKVTPFGHSYAETSESDFSKDGDVISTPAHQRANMGH